MWMRLQFHEKADKKKVCVEGLFLWYSGDGDDDHNRAVNLYLGLYAFSSSKFHNNPGIISFLLQLRKERHREVKHLS